MEEALLYVSSSLLGVSHTHQVSTIITTSLSRNASLNVTGFLVYSGSRFAQYIEGESSAIDELMASIGRDSRHKDVLVVRREPVSQRRFESWSLAYAGASTYIAGHVNGLLQSPTDEHEHTRIRQFIRLAKAFVADVPF